MAKSQRLIRLIMIINSKKSFTVQELADEFGLSYRTITRDLQELSQLGIPIYSIQGRGGGYKLLRERILPPIAFSESEAVALFFACQSLQYFGSLPFDDGAASALHKFYHYLPADVRQHIDRLRNKVAIWSPRRIMSPEFLKTLMQAIMIHKAVTISYRSPQGLIKRDIQPIGLYSSDGYWYCPAYCHLRQEHRLFRSDRIHSAVLSECIPWSEELEKSDLMNIPEMNHSEQISLSIELTAQGTWLLEGDTWFGPFIERRADGSAAATIRIPAANLTFYVDWVWRLGAEARIVNPPEAVACLKQKLEAMNSQYR
ncbi:helix-turn-helix transcriptional regulator [Paenibacillus nasutitermitis]|uniref:DNA-binding transcriptional regulator n=1 Tax=Paenibacillus nasutitermitis TaxID=1652958 RepID=A0A916Z837_9BACL|nr:YafY family protein [Paenibacillus nasutitermitis]GGD79696.1 DNA-binding transcriptional regulator [Paenibacillus nasutitermitis]